MALSTFCLPWRFVKIKVLRSARRHAKRVPNITLFTLHLLQNLFIYWCFECRETIHEASLSNDQLDNFAGCKTMIASFITITRASRKDQVCHYTKSYHLPTYLALKSQIVASQTVCSFSTDGRYFFCESRPPVAIIDTRRICGRSCLLRYKAPSPDRRYDLRETYVKNLDPMTRFHPTPFRLVKSKNYRRIK